MWLPGYTLLRGSGELQLASKDRIKQEGLGRVASGENLENTEFSLIILLSLAVYATINLK